MHCSSKLIAPDTSHSNRAGLPDTQRPLLPSRRSRSRRSRSRSRSSSRSRSPRNLCTNQNGRKRSRSRYSRATARTWLHVAPPPSPSRTTQHDALPASGEAVGRTRRQRTNKHAAVAAQHVETHRNQRVAALGTDERLSLYPLRASLRKRTEIVHAHRPTPAVGAPDCNLSLQGIGWRGPWLLGRKAQHTRHVALAPSAQARPFAVCVRPSNASHVRPWYSG